jgi:hypothetical protein
MMRGVYYKICTCTTATLGGAEHEVIPAMNDKQGRISADSRKQGEIWFKSLHYLNLPLHRNLSMIHAAHLKRALI